MIEISQCYWRWGFGCASLENKLEYSLYIFYTKEDAYKEYNLLKDKSHAITKPYSFMIIEDSTGFISRVMVDTKSYFTNVISPEGDLCG